jgi:hypothetical protein
MMFKFYQPQKKEQKMIKPTVVWDEEYFNVKIFPTSVPVGITHYRAFDLMVALAEALKIATPVHTPSATTPPDPALLLAQRIASISAETGLKPRLVYNIVNHIDWQEEDKAEKAKQAAVPQENNTDGSVAQLLRIAGEVGLHDSAALTAIANRILAGEIY